MAVAKTIKLKKIASEETESAPLEPTSSAQAGATSGSAAPAGLGPVSVAASAGASSASYRVYAILGIVATLFCLAIIGMQFSEMSFYTAEPSMWPLK